MFLFIRHLNKIVLGVILLASIFYAIIQYIHIQEDKKKLEDEVDENNRLNEELQKETFELNDNLEKTYSEVKEKDKLIDKKDKNIKDKDKEIKSLKEDKSKLTNDNSKLKSDLEAKKKREKEKNTMLAQSNNSSKSAGGNTKNFAHASKKVESNSSGRELTVEATAYTAFCTGCSGITSRGSNVKNTIYHSSGYRIIAVDPSVIPLGSIVEINGTKYIADDTGGAIKGSKIDILVGNNNEAVNFGRRSMKIKVIS